MVRLRLARFGAKDQPTYRIVAADSRAPRDGKVLEYLGSYNPRTDPPTMKLDSERAMRRLRNGAQPSEAVERIMRKLGVREQIESQKQVAEATAS
jgi:small subunit ribosomal protein S16